MLVCIGVGKTFSTGPVSGETDGGQGGAAAPPGRSFWSFWAPCYHIVNFIKWSLIDIAVWQCVVLMIFGTLNYKNTLFLEKYRKTSHHFFNLEHRNQTLLKNSA